MRVPANAARRARAERPWLKPAIIGGGLFVAGITAFLILRR